MIPRFADTAVWREDENGEGRLEVALFPRPVVKAEDVTLKTITEKRLRELPDLRNPRTIWGRFREMLHRIEPAERSEKH